jgi:hypothetical protein
MEKPVLVHQTQFVTSLHPIQALLATAHHPHASAAETLRATSSRDAGRDPAPHTPGSGGRGDGARGRRRRRPRRQEIGGVWSGSHELRQVRRRSCGSGDFFVGEFPDLDFWCLNFNAGSWQPSTLASLYCGFAAVDTDEDDSPWSCRVAPALQVHAGRCMSSTEWS